MKASIGVMTLLLAGAPALAQPPETLPSATGSATVDSAVVAPVEQIAPDVETENVHSEDDDALSLEELGELRGGEAIVIQHTTQTLTANNAGNSVNGDTVGSGAVNLTSNAFNGYDGIGNFVINTGHNNNLQGSISVSIAMTPQ